jgi:hypothetical protein
LRMLLIVNWMPILRRYWFAGTSPV